MHFPLYAPHETKPKVKPIEALLPRVALTWDVFTKTQCLIECCLEKGRFRELSWLGRVEIREADDIELYVITAIRPFKQMGHQGRTFIPPEVLNELMDEWGTSGGEGPMPWRFWGHVHSGQSAAMSPIDQRQIDSFLHGSKYTKDYWLVGIYTHDTVYATGLRRAEYTLYDYRRRVTFEDLTATILHPPCYADIAAEVEKVFQADQPATTPAYVGPAEGWYGMGAYQPVPCPSVRVIQSTDAERAAVAPIGVTPGIRVIPSPSPDPQAAAAAPAVVTGGEFAEPPAPVPAGDGPPKREKKKGESP